MNIGLRYTPHVRLHFVTADVRHQGAWIPAHALHNPDAAQRLLEWIRHSVANLNKRVIVTPRGGGLPFDGVPVLRALANGAAHRSANGSTDCEWGSSPVVLVGPDDRSLERAVPMVAHQTLIVFEESGRLDLQGWATAAGAYSAATGQTVPPLCDSLRRQFAQLLSFDFELAASAVRGNDRDRPQRHLRKLVKAGLDEDFMVTYALALDRSIPAKQIRQHCHATAARPPWW